MTRVLVTGAAGQIGTELASALRDRYGADRVLVTDVKPLAEWHSDAGPGERLDCLDPSSLADVFRRFDPDLVFHLAAILSARGEERPAQAWDINVGTLRNVLDAALAHGDTRVFVPSSIAAFGPAAPKDPTPQRTFQRPGTMYGVTKVVGELLSDYYHGRWGLDVRGLRFPGLLSYSAPPGGGTTDYAVEIFHHALAEGRYTCFLAPETRLDMMYIDDAVRAALELMEAPEDGLVDRNAYNITAMQFTPAELGEAIRVHLPEFVLDYHPDPLKQRIADSWPDRIDDAAAREQWGWEPAFGLAETVSVMIDGLTRMRKDATPRPRTGTHQE